MQILKKHKNYKIFIGLMIGILIPIISVWAVNKYRAEDVFYDNENSNLSSANVQGAVDELSDKYKKIYGDVTSCPDGYLCLQKKSTLALGDYVKMTPTKSSYTTDTSKTGYTSTQTINPQELNLWRVIKLNDDGTVEMISEHVSSTAVYFRGQTGYQNLVGYLNVLASQYENSTYTVSSRYFGYNGQTEYITDTSKFKHPAPWTCSTGASCNPTEELGGGDTSYTTDYNLINTVLGTRVATNPGGSSASYWIASRRYSYSSSTSFGWRRRYVDTSDSLGSSSLYSSNGSSFGTYVDGSSLRPIVVLKSGLKYSGMGTENYPMEISTS